MGFHKPVTENACFTEFVIVTGFMSLMIMYCLLICNYKF